MSARPQRPAAPSTVELQPVSHGELLAVHGPLVARSAHAVLDAVGLICEEAGPSVVIDFSATTTLDEFGRAALRRAGRELASSGKAVFVIADAETHQRLGEIAALVNARRVLRSRRQAVAAVIAASVW